MRSMLLLVPLMLTACEPRDIREDSGEVCTAFDGQPGEVVLVILANSADCSGEDRNSDFECEVSVADDVVTVHTTLYEGQDRDAGCSPLEATCTTAIEPGAYTLRYGDQESQLTVPSEDPICLLTREPP